MGLFGFIGKAVGGLVKTVGKVGIGAVKSGLLPIPGGGIVGKLAGTLLASKSPNSTTSIKYQLGGRQPILRAKTPITSWNPRGNITQSGTRPLMPTTRLQQASPVMPGGAIATVSGLVSANGTPPATFGGSSRTGRKRRSSRKRSSAKRSGRKRRLKFGSPAWRKKYLGHGRKRRKRAA